MTLTEEERAAVEKYGKPCTVIDLAHVADGPIANDACILAACVSRLESELSELKLTREMERISGAREIPAASELIERAEKAESEAASYRAALEKIVTLDPSKDSDMGWNDLGFADCFEKAQAISERALSRTEGR